MSFVGMEHVTSSLNSYANLPLRYLHVAKRQVVNTGHVLQSDDYGVAATYANSLQYQCGSSSCLGILTGNGC